MENQLRYLFCDGGLSDDDVADKVNLACEDAFYKLMYADAPSYVDILGDSQQQVKEYFDGRGWVNTEHEYERAMGLGAEVLNRLPIQWPGDSCFDYDKKIPEKVHSQFSKGHFSKFKTRGHGRTAQRTYYPVQNFDKCALNTAMCCWTESTGKNHTPTSANKEVVEFFAESHHSSFVLLRIADETLVYGHQGGTNVTDSNTDICYVNFGEAPTSSRVRAGFAIFPGLSEVSSGQGSVRCHGFSWAEDPMDVSNFFKGNALFQASL